MALRHIAVEAAVAVYISSNEGADCKGITFTAIHTNNFIGKKTMNVTKLSFSFLF